MLRLDDIRTDRFCSGRGKRYDRREAQENRCIFTEIQRARGNVEKSARSCVLLYWYVDRDPELFITFVLSNDEELLITERTLILITYYRNIL